MPAPGIYEPSPTDSFRVYLSVRCRECRVWHTAGGEREEVTVERAWSKSFRVRDTGLGFVQLVASPAGSPGYIERAYIEIDGVIVAEARRGASGAMNEDVTLSAPLVKSR